MFIHIGDIKGQGLFHGRDLFRADVFDKTMKFRFYLLHTFTPVQSGDDIFQAFLLFSPTRLFTHQFPPCSLFSPAAMAGGGKSHIPFMPVRLLYEKTLPKLPALL